MLRFDSEPNLESWLDESEEKDDWDDDDDDELEGDLELVGFKLAFLSDLRVSLSNFFFYDFPLFEGLYCIEGIVSFYSSSPFDNLPFGDLDFTFLFDFR